MRARRAGAPAPWWRLLIVEGQAHNPVGLDCRPGLARLDEAAPPAGAPRRVVRHLRFEPARPATWGRIYPDEGAHEGAGDARPRASGAVHTYNTSLPPAPPARR